MGRSIEQRRALMPEITEALEAVQAKTTAAFEQTVADEGASPVLAAVVREFASKCDKARAKTRGGAAAREAVVELEQAGDSAKAAAEADPGASEATRTLVLDAHLAICMLKAELA
jgi:hypothetical protein